MKSTPKGTSSWQSAPMPEMEGTEYMFPDDKTRQQRAARYTKAREKAGCGCIISMIGILILGSFLLLVNNVPKRDAEDIPPILCVAGVCMLCIGILKWAINTNTMSNNEE